MSDVKEFKIPVIRATKELMKDYGQWIGTEVEAVTDIPFYKGKVIEGKNFDFHYHEKAVIRTAKLLPRDDFPVNWLERHMRLSQLFVGLGCEPFCLILGKPTKDNLPDMSNVACFMFPPGSGIIIHLGTWHDPIPVLNAVTVMTMNSAEVVKALEEMKEPGDMNQGDVYKINVVKHLNLKVSIEGMPCIKDGFQK